MTGSNFTIKQLYKISKYCSREAFFESQMEIAGSNQSRILERMKKSSSYMKQQNTTMKIAVSIYLIMLVLIPISIFLQLNRILSLGISKEYLVFSSSMMLSLYFGMQWVYIVFFGLYTSASIIGGKYLDMLRTLPLNERDLRKITILTLIRSVNAQIIVMSISLPIAVIIVMKDFWLTLLSFFLSVCNVLFAIVLLMSIGKWLNNVLRTNEGTSIKSTLVRVGTMLVYIIGILMVSMSMQYLLPLTEKFLVTPSISEPIVLQLNYFVSLIPFPFSYSYLFSYIMFGLKFGFGFFTSRTWIQFFLSLIGFTIFILYLRRQWRKNDIIITDLIASPKDLQSPNIGLNQLSSLKDSLAKSSSSSVQVNPASMNQLNIESRNMGEEKVLYAEYLGVKVETPIKAFLKKDLRMATRDMQVLMMLIMPIILPLFSLFSMSQSAEPGMDESDIVMMFFTLGIFYAFMGMFMVTLGILNTDSAGASVLASLPIRVRDQVIAKIKIISFVLALQIILIIVLSFIFIQDPIVIKVVFLLFIFYFLLVGSSILLLIFKAVLFGRLNPNSNRIVLEEINLERKNWKWALIFIIGIIYSVSILIGMGFMVYNNDLVLALEVMGSLIIGINLLAHYLLKKYFP